MAGRAGDGKGGTAGATVNGTVEEIIYRNESNGYVIADLRVDDECVTALGTMPFLQPGERIEAVGEWVSHPSYGPQFKVRAYEKALPESEGDLLSYLGSGAIKGVGPATAAKIVSRFGAKTMSVIENEPDSLAQVKGITAEKAAAIGEAFMEQKALRNVMMFCSRNAITPSVAVKAYERYGAGAIDAIRENPYRLAEGDFGIGFRKADEIAMRLGVSPDSKDRVRAGVRHALSQASLNGHTYLPEAVLRRCAADLLGLGPGDGGEMDDGLTALIMDGAAVAVRGPADGPGMGGGEPGGGGAGRRIYLRHLFESELRVSQILAEMAGGGAGGDGSDMAAEARAIGEAMGLSLAGMQEVAVVEAMRREAVVITGGPGTGKTTIINVILRMCEKRGLTVCLSAPTGRAAKRMTEATLREAKTIHRMLEMGFAGDEGGAMFGRGAENPIEADVIVVDEMSMVDIQLMRSLLAAVAKGTKTVFIGDVDQLPSVGAGNVLGDMIGSGSIYSVRLTEIFRQSEESLIVSNAHRINRGELPLLGVKDRDFFFMQKLSQESAVEAIVDLCRRRIPERYGYDPFRQIQVLSPTKKGPTGVANLNAMLQGALNPPDPAKAELSRGEVRFRLGDKVMQTKNNYGVGWRRRGDGATGEGVYNGDIGIVAGVDLPGRSVTVVFDDEREVVYDFEEAGELDQAYAVTVHKSQGSEFEAVVMPVFEGPPVLLTRNLLYTAITRAKALVVLIGREGAVSLMVENQREATRYSGLADMLRKA
ncbi:MAG: ATP-dependent RecD-like DNA helicase [Oscillospiraceae bacterium]|nr:ATP-dependent RecD-like DNA helicase [Oscillospiraceae bacterium]